MHNIRRVGAPSSSESTMHVGYRSSRVLVRPWRSSITPRISLRRRAAPSPLQPHIVGDRAPLNAQSAQPLRKLGTAVQNTASRVVWCARQCLATPTRTALPARPRRLHLSISNEAMEWNELSTLVPG